MFAVFYVLILVLIALTHTLIALAHTLIVISIALRRCTDCIYHCIKIGQVIWPFLKLMEYATNKSSVKTKTKGRRAKYKFYLVITKKGGGGLAPWTNKQ